MDKYNVVLHLLLFEMYFNFATSELNKYVVSDLFFRLKGTLYFMVKKLPPPMPSRANA